MYPVGPPKTYTPQPEAAPPTEQGNPLRASEVVSAWISNISSALVGGNYLKPESVALCPVSLPPVLGMMLAAMDEQKTKEKFLGLPPGSLTPALEVQIHQELGAFSRAHPFSQNSMVSTANFLTSSRPGQYHGDLVGILQDAYHTDLNTVNCSASVADATNAYVASKTEGRITNAFGELSGANRNRMVLALGNVLKFQGIWLESFEKSNTRPRVFHCADGSIINNVLMMHLTCKLQFASCRGFNAVAKPFRSENGNELNLVAIQPKRKHDPLGLPPILLKRAVSDLIEMTSAAPLVTGELTLPRINISYTDGKLFNTLGEITGLQITPMDLAKLGLSADDQLGVHRTINVSLDEEGARGAVANVGYSLTRSKNLTQVFTFDRPGYIAIVDGSGNRLMEATISDGQFLETSGAAKITIPPRLSSIDDLFSDAPLECSKKTGRAVKPVAIEEDISQSPSEVAGIVQKKLNARGEEFTFIEISNDLDALRIRVTTKDEAKKLQDKILELIGFDHFTHLKIIDLREFGRHVLVKISPDAKDKLLI